MAQIWTLERDDFERDITSGMKLMINRMLKDGVITEEQHDHYMINYAVVIAKPSLFSSFWDKLPGKKSDRRLILVQNMSMEEELVE